jgi:hypothetical protein
MATCRLYTRPMGVPVSLKLHFVIPFKPTQLTRGSTVTPVGELHSATIGTRAYGAPQGQLSGQFIS